METRFGVQSNLEEGASDTQCFLALTGGRRGVAMIKRVLSRCVVMVCMVLLAAIVDCGRASSEEEVEIKGTVFAIDNDDMGKAIEVSVLDRAGNEYFVVHDQTGISF